MLTNIQIQNFKSIRDLSFEARRVNLFIGEPNTGKTNILEALALLSEGVHEPRVFKEIFRFRNISDLFADQQVSNPIAIETTLHSDPLVQAALRVTNPIAAQAPSIRCSLSFQESEFTFIAQKFHPEQEKTSYKLSQTGARQGWSSLQFGIKYLPF